MTCPEVAFRDCGLCQKYEYDHQTGEQLKRAGGLPVLRSPVSHVPCRTPQLGCAKGTPEDSKALSPKNELAFQHYKQCRAVGEFPDDSLVRQHAAIIREVEDQVAEGREDGRGEALARILRRSRG